MGPDTFKRLLRFDNENLVEVPRINPFGKVRFLLLNKLVEPSHGFGIAIGLKPYIAIISYHHGNLRQLKSVFDRLVSAERNYI